jgi:hypothetical protein
LGDAASSSEDKSNKSNEFVFTIKLWTQWTRLWMLGALCGTSTTTLLRLRQFPAQRCTTLVVCQAGLLLIANFGQWKALGGPNPPFQSLFW